jgi:uncharacterized protein YaiE (UPF0345 family)
MDNEDLNLDLDNLEVQAEEKLKVKNRFEKLSEKVILTSREKDEALSKAQTEADARIKAEKERDFYKDFSANVSKYPNASEYQEKILEKVNAGYSTEDAMVAVLVKEGKFTSETSQVSSPQVEGGSASTALPGNKEMSDMTATEKFEALKEADKSGALVNALRGR